MLCASTQECEALDLRQNRKGLGVRSASSRWCNCHRNKGFTLEEPPTTLQARSLLMVLLKARSIVGSSLKDRVLLSKTSTEALMLVPKS